MWDFEMDELYDATEEMSDYLATRFTIDWQYEADDPNDQFRPLMEHSTAEELERYNSQLETILALDEPDFREFVAGRLALPMALDERRHLGKSYREWLLDLRNAIADRLAGGEGVMPELHPIPRPRPVQEPATSRVGRKLA